MSVPLSSTGASNESALIDILNRAQRDVRVDSFALSIGELVSMYEDDELIIRPEYQRLLKWNTDQKTQLVESVLVGLPLPCIFVSDNEQRKWEVVDGLQRISTLVDYVVGLKPADTEFIDQYRRFERLTGELTYLEQNETPESQDIRSGFWSLSFKELPPAVQRQFKQARINVTILRAGTSDNIKYELFQRLNNSGVNINPQELRNAILAFKRKDYQDALNRLAEHAFFRTFKTVSGSKPKNDQNAQRLALMLIAFMHVIRKNSARITVDSVEHYITGFVRKELCGPHADQYDAAKDEADVTRAFEQAMQAAEHRDNLFVRSNLFSETMFLCIMLGVLSGSGHTCDVRKLRTLLDTMENAPEFKNSRIISSGVPLGRRIFSIAQFLPYFKPAFG